MRNLLGNSIIDKVLNLNKASFLSVSENIETSNSDYIENNKKSNSQSFPQKFDWRDMNGVNYDSPVRKQGECGSCYAISAITVLESRIRIKTGNKYKPILSPSSVISCSRYNQGCNGGYPYLVGKHAKEFGFVEEKCQVYDQKDNYCNMDCFSEKSWKAKNYG
jgi:cathepsin C